MINQYKDIKGGHLAPNETCEYIYECKEDNCEGRNKNRKSKFNCTLRKALLMTDGYKVIYGYSNNEVKEREYNAKQTYSKI